jgi:hypothetical protein
MSKIRVPHVLVAMSAALVVLGTSDPAFAYIGPGAGVSAIGTVITLFFAVILTIVGFVWYPVKRLLKRRSRVQKP